MFQNPCFFFQNRDGNRVTERNWALASCVFNSVDATGWLIRALLSIVFLASIWVMVRENLGRGTSLKDD